MVIEDEKTIKITLYLSHICLNGISEEITRILKTNPEWEPLPISELKIQSGLPHLDYGQTITVVLRKGDFACMKNFPAYDSQYSDQVLLHS